MGQAQGNPIGVAGWADSAGQRARRMRATRRVATWGGARAWRRRRMRATRRVATWGDAGRVRSAAWRRGGGALHGRGGADHRQPGADHRQGVASSRQPITVRAWPAAGSRSHRQGVGSSGAGDPPSGRGSIGTGDHRQGAEASGRRDPPGRAWQQQAADHRQQGGQGLKAAKSSHAKDESPTGILSTHIRVAAEKNFFTPRRGVIWAEKRPFPARGRKPCYDFCVGRESPPAKQKLHSADHGAERISP